jgi:LysR family transcriptional regulator, transcription activator of glutamate synthase operon
MELRQIQYFMEVAKVEHVTAASYTLNVAQSAVSRQILKLESELGVDLFIHEGRKVKLTPIGKTFLQHMEQLMKVIEKAQDDINEYLDPEKGTIRIGFPSSLAAQIVPDVISAFRKLHPLVQFKLQHGSYRELTDWVVSGEINLAIMGPVPQDDASVRCSVLFEEYFMVLMHENHPLADELTVRLRELKGDSFVLFPKEYILREIVVNVCRKNGFRPKIAFEGDDLDAIKGLVAAGLGITILPETALGNNIPENTVMVPVSNPYVTRNVGVIAPVNRDIAPTEKLFLEFLKRYKGYQKTAPGR